MELIEPHFIRLTDLSELADVHQTVIVRLLGRHVITADALLKHGKTLQPIFHSDRVSDLLIRIAEYRASLKSDVAA